ncbi:MAG TPA: hypothetical protein VFV31_03080 [Chitinophagaceae bacterium]|nr:hypothetical protein [Chitinophagaceae bacterium]
MKKLFWSLSFLIITLAASGQPDSSLKARLDAFMNANDLMDFEKVMDYTYPKLFTLATREQMIEVMNNSMNNEDMTIRLDSLKIDSIYAVFTTAEGSFAKVDYSMLMLMQLKEEADKTKNNEKNDAVIAALKEQYGEDKVKYDEKVKAIKIYVNTAMAAIKDSYAKEWCFLNFKEDDPMIEALLSKEVIEKLSSY